MKVYSKQELEKVIKGCENDEYAYIVSAAHILSGIIDGTKDSEDKDIKTTLWVKFMQAYTRCIRNSQIRTITFDCRIDGSKTGLQEF